MSSNVHPPSKPLSSNQLIKRIITASILIPIVVIFILFLPNRIFTFISGVFILAAFAEWIKLSGYQKYPSFIDVVKFIGLFIIFCALIIGLYFGLEYLFFNIGVALFPFSLMNYFYAGVLFVLWVAALWAVVIFPKFTEKYTQGPFALLVGCLVLIPAWLSMNQLRYLDPRWLLYLFILVWIADIAAYFTGKKWGKHKLLPHLSPGKTWEGVAGALFGVFLFSIPTYYYFDVKISFALWLVLNLIITVFSIVGDLFESIFKRVHQLKDSGTLFPGHGGIMDRIDSLTAALPIFTAMMMVIE